ncbi:hypothetical protein [Streptomyces kebangsaanensis]|uniref:hypothetical protein n=1 Tax=Streptomyces kebangsaanensis TaxID=864058 RepID=UPI000A97409A|nr:hypothetical protein [Streptomyces kebangsaanensis]
MAWEFGDDSDWQSLSGATEDRSPVEFVLQRAYEMGLAVAHQGDRGSQLQDRAGHVRR